MRWPLLERRHMKTKKLLRHSLFFLLLFAGGSTVLAQDTKEESTVWEQDCAKESTVNPGGRRLYYKPSAGSFICGRM